MLYIANIILILDWLQLFVIDAVENRMTKHRHKTWYPLHAAVCSTPNYISFNQWGKKRLSYNDPSWFYGRSFMCSSCLFGLCCCSEQAWTIQTNHLNGGNERESRWIKKLLWRTAQFEIESFFSHKQTLHHSYIHVYEHGWNELVASYPQTISINVHRHHSIILFINGSNERQHDVQQRQRRRRHKKSNTDESHTVFRQAISHNRYI